MNDCRSRTKNQGLYLRFTYARPITIKLDRIINQHTLLPCDQCDQSPRLYLYFLYFYKFYNDLT